jgi:hypothetical protein
LATKKYIYLKKDCIACSALKASLREAGTSFIERNADRLSLDHRIFDQIDKEAFLQLQMQDLTFPVEIDIVN